MYKGCMKWEIVMYKVNVVSEFAPLKEVVLAESEFGFSSEDVYVEMGTEAYDFLDPKYADLEVGHYGEDFKTAYPELQMKWESEKIEMEKTLTKLGIKVIRPRKLTIDEKEKGSKSGDGYSNFFSRDPFFTIGSTLIKGSMKLPHRKHEIETINETLAERAIKDDVPYIQSEGFLEGGDVLVLDKTVFVGNSGLASDEIGTKWLAKILPEYTIVPVMLNHKILHLDCALSLVRPGLMIICPEAFVDGIPPELSDWEYVSVTLEEAMQLMCNGLPIDEHTYITDIAFHSVIEQLEAKNVNVIGLDYEISRMFGGSFRCTTQPLVRH